VVKEEDLGGEIACWTHLVCTVCSSVAADESHTHDPSPAPST